MDNSDWSRFERELSEANHEALKDMAERDLVGGGIASAMANTQTLMARGALRKADTAARFRRLFPEACAILREDGWVERRSDGTGTVTLAGYPLWYGPDGLVPGGLVVIVGNGIGDREFRLVRLVREVPRVLAFAPARFAYRQEWVVSYEPTGWRQLWLRFRRGVSFLGPSVVSCCGEGKHD